MRPRALWPAVLLATGAGAQVATPPSKDVVVTGRRQVPLKEAQRFVHQVIALNEGQLARFADPVCPSVLGVGPALAAAVEARYREIAGEADVPLARAGCAPNVMIALVDDADSFVKLVRRRHGGFFDSLQDVDLHDAFRAGPVHSWRLIETRDDEGNGGGTAGADAPATYGSETQTVTVNAIVVVNKRAVLGKSSRQIADYAAMRTLAGARPPKSGTATADTILALFDPGVATPPAELTSMDRRLMAGLYALRGEQRDAMAQAGQLSRHMAAVPGAGGTRRRR